VVRGTAVLIPSLCPAYPPRIRAASHGVYSTCIQVPQDKCVKLFYGVIRRARHSASLPFRKARFPPSGGLAFPCAHFAGFLRVNKDLHGSLPFQHISNNTRPLCGKVFSTFLWYALRWLSRSSVPVRRVSSRIACRLNQPTSY